MAGDTVITIIGNTTGDPKPPVTPSGAVMAKFTPASTSPAARPDEQRVEGRRDPVHAVLGVG